MSVIDHNLVRCINQLLKNLTSANKKISASGKETQMTDQPIIIKK